MTERNSMILETPNNSLEGLDNERNSGNNSPTNAPESHKSIHAMVLFSNDEDFIPTENDILPSQTRVIPSTSVENILLHDMPLSSDIALCASNQRSSDDTLSCDISSLSATADLINQNIMKNIANVIQISSQNPESDEYLISKDLIRTKKYKEFDGDHLSTKDNDNSSILSLDSINMEALATNIRQKLVKVLERTNKIKDPNSKQENEEKDIDLDKHQQKKVLEEEEIRKVQNFRKHCEHFWRKCETEDVTPEYLNWEIEDVAQWIKNIGFPQYSDCFRHNYISGRKLIHMRYSTLPSIGIKDFNDIKAISKEIYQLLMISSAGYGPCTRYMDAPTLFLLMKSRSGKPYDNMKYREFLSECQSIIRT